MQLGLRAGVAKGLLGPSRAAFGLTRRHCLSGHVKRQAALATLERAPGSRGQVASRGPQKVAEDAAPAVLTGFQAVFLTAFAALMTGIAAKR